MKGKMIRLEIVQRTYLLTVPARYSAIEYLAFPLGFQDYRGSRLLTFLPPLNIIYLKSYFEYRTFSLHFRIKYGRVRLQGPNGFDFFDFD